MKRMQRANQRTEQTIDSGIYWDYLYDDAGNPCEFRQSLSA